MYMYMYMYIYIYIYIQGHRRHAEGPAQYYNHAARYYTVVYATMLYYSIHCTTYPDYIALYPHCILYYTNFTISYDMIQYNII